MDLDQSVTCWIDGLRDGSEQSAQRLWERYFQQLVRLAGSRLPRNVRRGFDEEDVALSAFHSLCKGVQKGSFPKLDDRDNLWGLLVVITARKALQRVRKATAKKRGGGNVLGESALQVDGEGSVGPGINQIIGKEPSVEFANDFSAECNALLDLLPDEDMRKLALLKMEGHNNKEAAEQLGCGVRTVERRLGLIRKIWAIRG